MAAHKINVNAVMFDFTALILPFPTFIWIMKVPFTLGVVGHFGLAVGDPKKSARWFQRVLGLRKEFEFDNGIAIGNDNVTIALFKGNIWASGFTIRTAIAGSFQSKAANRSVGAARKLRFVLRELNCERDAITHRGMSKMGCRRFRRGLCPDETLRGQPYS